jgi:uncharacterized protein involved in exopolysaccharide biosynthesis
MLSAFSAPGEAVHASWDDFWYTVRTSTGVIAAVFAATVAGAYIGLQVQDDIYESEARILVKLGRENMEPPATVEKGVVASSGIRKEEIFTNMVLLSSQPVVKQALDSIGVDSFRPPLPEPRTAFERIKRSVKAFGTSVKQAVEDMLVTLNIEKRLSFHDKVLLGIQNSLTVDRDKESDVIVAKLRLPSPELAQRFLDALIARYRDAHIEVRKDAGSSDFFQKKTSESLATVNASADAKAKIRTEYALSSIEEERGRLLTRQHALLAEIESDQRDLTLVSRVKDDGAAALGRGELTPSNPSLQIMKDRITQQRIRRIELLSLMQPESEQVTNVDAEITALELVLARALRQRIEVKKRQVADLEKRLAELNDGERRLDAIERDSQIALKTYASYAERLEESRISEELDRRRVANISVLSAPTLPLRPVSPRRLLIMMLSIPAGLALGLATAVLLRALSDRIRRPGDLADIEGLAFLGTFDLKRS